MERGLHCCIEEAHYSRKFFHIHQPVITKTNMKWERSSILDVERYLPAHLPKRNKYHLHEAEDLEITNQKISIGRKKHPLLLSSLKINTYLLLKMTSYMLFYY
jgi:hypothetical protein